MEEEQVKRRKGAAPSGATWETIYCSLALILVAFFAMLVSYSSIDEGKTTNFKRGFGGDQPKGIEGLMSYGTGGFKTDKGKGSAILKPSKDIIKDENSKAMLTLEVLKKYLRDTGLGNTVRVEQTKGGFKAVFENDVLFSSGVAEISPALYPVLDRLTQVAKESTFDVWIEGHTDKVPISTPRFPSNWELSTDRAISVLRYFMDRGGLPAKRLSAVGFGQYRPVASNNTAEGRGKNRRVECRFENVGAYDSGEKGGTDGETP